MEIPIDFVGIRREAVRRPDLTRRLPHVLRSVPCSPRVDPRLDDLRRRRLTLGVEGAAPGGDGTAGDGSALATTPLDTEVLDDIAAGLASVAEPTGPVRPWEVRTTLLLATAAYDAYLMEWGPAAMSDTHDHDGSVGVVHVVSGTLLESSQAIESPLPSPVRRLGEGDATQIEATRFHRIFNRSSGTAVSVHVFSPPVGEH